MHATEGEINVVFADLSEGSGARGACSTDVVREQEDTRALEGLTFACRPIASNLVSFEDSEFCCIEIFGHGKPLGEGPRWQSALP